MKLVAVLCTALLIAASSAATAGEMNLQIQPIQQAPAPIAPMVPIAPLQANPDAVQLNTEEAKLKRKVARLEYENRKLKLLNEALSERVHDFTVLGGSEVRAYCATPNTSMNTAGESRDCELYACDAVSGMCKDRCATSDDCSGFALGCDNGQCVRVVIESEE